MFFKNKEQITIHIKVILLFIIILLLIGTEIGILNHIPKHANVYVDDVNKKIYGLRSISYNDTLKFRLTTYQEALNLKYELDKTSCQNMDLFQEKNLTVFLLEKIGILKLKSRWNKDGTWNW